MESYKMMLILAVVFGSLAVFFSTMAIFHLCTADDQEIKDYYCKGTIYDDIRDKFGKPGYEYTISTMQILSHVFALTFGIVTVVMSGIGLCTDCSSNKAFMICTVIVAVLAFSFMVTAAGLRTNWFHYFTVTNPNVSELDQDPLSPDVAARLYRGRVNMANFWIAVIFSLTTFVFILIATIMTTCEKKN